MIRKKSYRINSIEDEEFINYALRALRSSRLIICSFFIAYALTLNARILTYDEAVQIALNQSYTIKSYELDKKATQFYFDFNLAQFKPRIDLELSTPQWDERVEQIQRPDGLPVYNSIGSYRYSGDLSFTYMLPTGGNLALSSTLYRDDIKTNLALQNYELLKTNKAYSRFGISFTQPILTANRLKENLKEAEYRYERASAWFTRGQMDIIYEVTGEFYNLYRATRQLEIAEQQCENAKVAYQTANILYKNGRIPEVEVMNTEVDYAESRGRLSEAKNMLERERDLFKHLIGLEFDEDIQIMTDLKFDTIQVDLDIAIRSALRDRLDLKEFEANIHLQEIQVDRAKRISELRGDISAYYDFTGVSTIESGETRALFESSFDNFVDRKPNRGVTVNFSWSVFDWGRERARVQEETARLRNREIDLEDRQNQIIREVRDVVRSVQEAKTRLGILEKSQKVSELTYRINQKQFENGNINSRELALQQEQLSQSQLSYLNAFITYQLALADLKRKTLWNFEEGRSYLIEEN